MRGLLPPPLMLPLERGYHAPRRLFFDSVHVNSYGLRATSMSFIRHTISRVRCCAPSHSVVRVAPKCICKVVGEARRIIG